MKSARDVLYEKSAEISKRFGFLGPYEEMKEIALELAEEVLSLREKEERRK